jgi:hypothetical protein
MDDFFLYEEYNSLSPILCNKLIELFTSSKKTYAGITQGGLNINIKDTTDLIIPRNDSDIHEVDKWRRIDKLLMKELKHNIIKYFSRCSSKLKNITGEDMIPEDNYSIKNFQIQKYVKNEGKYVYHNDFAVDWELQMCRKLTFIWYLNDVEEGGETEILGHYKVKPKVGKLFIFPSTWSYYHSGKVPLSNDKYIITGWVYSKI